MQARGRPKRPTQRTIAEKAGISVGAVSRALANDPLIASDTRALVNRIAEEVGYTPDRAAQHLRTGRTNVIALILPPHDEILGFGTSLIRGITTALHGTFYHLVVMPDFGLDRSETLIRRVVRDGLADGLLFSRTEVDDRRIRFLLEADFPFVCHGRSELATPHPFVDYDNADFVRKAARHLVARGAGRLAILLPPRRFTFANHMLHGFMSTVRETGVGHEIIEAVTLDSSPESIEATFGEVFARPDGPDGMIAPGEVSGLAALAAMQDRGRVPGRDVHLVVKQTTGVFDLVRPRVPSLYEDLAAAGESLARLLIRRIAGEPATDLQYIQDVGEIRER